MYLRKAIEEDVFKLIREKLEIDFKFEDENFLSKGLIELGISSLDSITILIELEEKYGIEFDEVFQTINEIVIYIEKKVYN